MKIYLSTAITRGRREYVEAVKRIVDLLRQEGVELLNEGAVDNVIAFLEGRPQNNVAV